MNNPNPWGSADPWRFVCVHCGGTTLSRAVGTAGRSHGRAAEVGRPTAVCNQCGASEPVVYDKKSGVQVEVS